MPWGWPAPGASAVSPALRSRLSQYVLSCARPVNLSSSRASDSLATVTRP